ncbi:amidohydrolase [Terrihabitans soli]|uniref:Amidohydrolase n=1 Tax=Terrihabitans soli TaxID=708113 RepID=A0A6S6QKI7_9HYPH|nr:alpha-D-ribose 1-methylphosphonate 5-triphosphate diphosphatase [Terrihabitans soli]BCJ89776.1 amidohydrolase [Terrihabitans soli]
MTITLTNAQLVTEDGIVSGTLTYDQNGIADVQPGASQVRGAEDAEGDFVVPGLIECHTDNLERHLVPRPGVIWPNSLAGALAHDAQIIASGITTVYDAMCIGGFDDEKDYRPKILGSMLAAVEEGNQHKLFRAEHRVHLRCETTDPKMMSYLERHPGTRSASLASLMDHTPGQRQWRDLNHYRQFIKGEGRTDAEIEEMIAADMERSAPIVADNFLKAVEFCKERGIAIASHDDTTIEHVDDAVKAGCTISEFPTTVEAAEAAHKAGMKTVGGAPNVVRGGSHSGGVSMIELAQAGLLDVLSSDYVPASLLQAANKLGAGIMPLHEAFGLVTWRAADMLGLADRGRLKKGLRADFVRFRISNGTPIVRAVTVRGMRVF